MAQGVSIHAPRAGRDGADGSQSTCAHGVSIHAPRAGRDVRRYAPRRLPICFNPRAPRGRDGPSLSSSQQTGIPEIPLT